MKNRKSTIIAAITIVISLALVIAGSAAAKAVDTRFECGPDMPYETTDPGEWSFPDGNIHIRGMQQVGRVDNCPDSRQVGYNYITVNANWDEDYTGPMWGTFVFISDEGGKWTGTWNGQMTADGSWYNAYGKGQGIYAGMKLWVNKYYELTSIRILDPKGE
jgi:hypothetical protein